MHAIRYMTIKKHDANKKAEIGVIIGRPLLFQKIRDPN